MNDDEKLRRPVRLTTAQLDQLNALLLRLKLARAVPQTETINRLLLRLALERAAQIEAEGRKGRK